MLVLMLSAKAQSGKDTFYNILSQSPIAKKKQIKRFAFADRLKEISREYGWTGSKEGEGRSFLIDVGQILRGDYLALDGKLYSKYTKQETIRASYNLFDLYSRLTQVYLPHADFWVTQVAKAIRMDANCDVAVITDWRFKNEFNTMRANFFNVITLRINRLSALQLSDPSETELDNFPFDFVIENNGTLEAYSERISEWACTYFPKHLLLCEGA